jgi:hypothetical protein
MTNRPYQLTNDDLPNICTLTLETDESDHWAAIDDCSPIDATHCPSQSDALLIIDLGDELAPLNFPLCRFHIAAAMIHIFDHLDDERD